MKKITNMKDYLREVAKNGIFQVCVDGNSISYYGRVSINHFLNCNDLPNLPEDWDWSWMVKDGELSGTFPKRYARFVKNTHDLKVDPGSIAKIGEIARNYVGNIDEGIGTFHIDFTQDFDWERGKFGDPDSCFWTCKEGAKDMLHQLDAYAIRFWHKEDFLGEYYEGFGRAWIVPDRPEQGMATVFNCYPKNWKLEGLSNVFSALTGLTNRRIGLLNNGIYKGELYINNGTGMIFGTEDQVAGWHDYDFQLHDPSLEVCSLCNDHILREDAYRVEGDYVCEDCYDGHCFTCPRCDERHYGNASQLINTDYGRQRWCSTCVDDFASQCEHCDELVPSGDTYGIAGIGRICRTCYSNLRECEECGQLVFWQSAQRKGYHFYCQECYAKMEVAHESQTVPPF